MATSLYNFSLNGSTNVASRYWYETTMAVVTASDGTQLLDYFDPRYVETIKAVTKSQSSLVDGTSPLTTVTYNIYNNTTMYKYVIAYNGIIHPLEMQIGSVIQFPNITQINNYLSTNVNASRKGQTVAV